MTPALEVMGVQKVFGGLPALDDVSLAVESGGRHALIGPNGAGKSTLFRIISGETRPTAGCIRFCGRNVTAESQARRAQAGMVQTFQHSRLFLSLTAAENVAVAAQRQRGTAARIFGTPWSKDVRADVAECLDAVGLAHRPESIVTQLSHGERRQLEVAVALAARPRVLLLDEPTAGMSPAETQRFVTLVSQLPNAISIVIIEHDLDVVFRLATHVSVLHLGRVIATGSPADVRADAGVQEAYLGATAKSHSPSGRSIR